MKISQLFISIAINVTDRQKTILKEVIILHLSQSVFKNCSHLIAFYTIYFHSINLFIPCLPEAPAKLSLKVPPGSPQCQNIILYWVIQPSDPCNWNLNQKVFSVHFTLSSMTKSNHCRKLSIFVSSSSILCPYNVTVVPLPFTLDLWHALMECLVSWEYLPVKFSKTKKRIQLLKVFIPTGEQWLTLHWWTWLQFRSWCSSLVIKHTFSTFLIETHSSPPNYMQTPWLSIFLDTHCKIFIIWAIDKVFIIRIKWSGHLF